MVKQHFISGGLSVVRALALVGTVALGACGAPTSPGGYLPPPASGDGGVSRPTDGGGSSVPASACQALCDNARRAMCGEFNENCVAGCNELVRQVPTRCAAQINAYMTCASRARIACASDGPEIQGCDAQDTAVSQCVEGGSNPPPTPGDRCLPDSAIPADIAATLCRALPQTPVPHDCPGGAPSSECVPVPSGEANVFCCAR